MKRALEVLLVAMVLVLSGFAALRLLSRREPAGALASGAASRAGRDDEDPRKPSAQPYAPAVGGVPMIRLTRPPRRRPFKTDIPAPAVRP
ncbi:MAG: hypothetical protein AAB262_06445 [Elusimicrobiota bacterium]